MSQCVSTSLGFGTELQRSFTHMLDMKRIVGKTTAIRITLVFLLSFSDPGDPEHTTLSTNTQH